MDLMSCWAEIKICRNKSQLVEPSSQSIKPGMFRILELAVSSFLYSDLQHLEYCLIYPIDLVIYILTSLCSRFVSCFKLLEPNTCESNSLKFHPVKWKNYKSPNNRSEI